MAPWPFMSISPGSLISRSSSPVCRTFASRALAHPAGRFSLSMPAFFADALALGRGVIAPPAPGADVGLPGLPAAGGAAPRWLLANSRRSSIDRAFGPAEPSLSCATYALTCSPCARVSGSSRPLIKSMMSRPCAANSRTAAP
jgi:hypothetical protein